MSEVEPTTPPVGEEIHLPGPTGLPIFNAAGITLAVIGLTLGWWLSALGVVIFVITGVMWIRDTRRDINDLPEQHHHP